MAHEIRTMEDFKKKTYYFGALIPESVFAMSNDQKKDFSSGQGHELNVKMRANKSSSALAVNMLGVAASKRLDAKYWNTTFGLRGFFLSDEIECHFEQKLPVIGVKGYTPNLDFCLTSNRRIIGLESKFCEMYRRKRKQRIQEQYFARFPYWDEWEGLRKTSENISDYGKAGRLDAAQLVKHALALITWAHRCNGKFRLVYIYHDILWNDKVKEEHEEDVKKFAAESGLGRHFMPLPYSRYFEKMQRFKASFEPEYFDYIKKRYAFC